MNTATRRLLISLGLCALCGLGCATETGVTGKPLGGASPVTTSGPDPSPSPTPSVSPTTQPTATPPVIVPSVLLNPTLPPELQPTEPPATTSMDPEDG